MNHIVCSSVVQVVLANPMSSILTLKFLRLSGAIEPDDVSVLLTAPTGVAAFNINGMILHSALLLGGGKYTGFQPLSHDRLNTLRSKLSKLTLSYH